MKRSDERCVADLTPTPLVRRAGPSHPLVLFSKDQVEQSIGARFEQQVRRHPDRLAVKTSTDQLTYGALNERANRVAGAILARPGRGEQPIALLLPSGKDQIAATLGTLKTGRPYVSLDPAYPSARNREILNDTQTELIVTDGKNEALACDLAGSRTSVLRIEEIEAGGSPDPPRRLIPSDSVAYIVYTSGTTGQPKGVMQSHRNVLHQIMGYTNGARLCSDDRISLLHSCSVNAAASSMFGALLNGAGLFPFDVRAEGLRRLAEWLRQEQITVYHSVPTLFRHLVEHLAVSGPAGDHLRLIRLGGEPVLRTDVDLYRRFFPPSCRLYVSLSSTESNLVCHFLMDHHTEFSGSTAPAGYPVEDTEILLLDEMGSEVSPGSVGEIAVKSRYLSPGYWRRPDLTAKAFRIAPDGEARIYCTGDLGRMLPDGCLVHLGRKDEQVKIRGFRVEVAEVEAALCEHPAIREAVVVTRQRSDGERWLVAYVVGSGVRLPAAPALRAWLLRKLPDYMVPALFQPVQRLPQTPGGKVDRRALAASDLSPAALPHRRTKPRTPMEVHLCSLWKELLEVRPVGVTDSFFDLGGDSLLAARLLARIERCLGKQIPLSALLQAPTVEQLAVLLQQDRPSAAEAALVALQPQGSRPPLFLVHGLRGHVLHFRELLPYMGADQPIYGLQMAGLSDLQLRSVSVESLAAHALGAVRALQPRGPYLLCGSSFGGKVAFEMARQLQAQGQPVALLALLDTLCRSPDPMWAARQRWRAHVVALRSLTLRSRCMYLTAMAQQRLRGESARLAQRIQQRLRPPLPQTLTAIELACQRASRTYVLQGYAGRVTLFRAMMGREGYLDPRSAWGKLAAGGLEIHDVPGDHLTMLMEPNVKRLAEQLMACIDRALDECADPLH